MNARERVKMTKFVELAEARVNKIIHALDSLSKLSNQNNYKYDQKQVKKIFEAISEKSESVKRLFDKDKSGRLFRLS